MCVPRIQIAHFLARSWLMLCVMPGLILACPPAHAAPEGTPNRIQIEYMPPKNPAHAELYRTLMEKGALEKLRVIFSPLKLPAEIKLTTLGCDGRVNAWYFRRTVLVCYEYLQHIHDNSPDENSNSKVTRTEAMMGQFFFVFAHEMGHAVFDLLGTPIFGDPEDAADKFATYVMLQFGKNDARGFIKGAAYGYKKAIMEKDVTELMREMADAHGTPAQRYYNMLCIAYGADRDLFADFVADGYLPERRANGCRREYGEIAYAFHQLILPNLDQALAKAVMQKEWLPEVTVQEARRQGGPQAVK